MRTIVLPIVALVVLMTGCEPPGPGDDPTGQTQVDLFNEDSTAEVYSDVWDFEDGRRLILKDNTYLIVQGNTAVEMGVVHTGARSEGGSFTLETTQIYSSEVTFETVGGLTDLSLLSAYTTLPGFSPPPPPQIPEPDEWIVEDEFEGWYEVTVSSYLEYQFDYIEEYYYEVTGIDLETFVPSWSSMLDQVVSANAAPTLAGDELFRSESMTYSIQQEDSNKRITMHGPSQDWSCVSSIPTDTLVWPDSFN